MGSPALIAIGLVALLVGAELVVRGGSRVARRLDIPPIVIGLTVVSIGTSAPELAIGVEAALDGVGELAVGNIAGTNVLNLVFILGLSALLRPLPLRPQTLRLDLPIMSIAAVALLILATDRTLSHLDGVLLLLIAVFYTVVIVLVSRRERAGVRERSPPHARRHTAPIAIIEVAVLLAGIVAVVLGADWLVQGAEKLARQLGVDDALIGLTVVAIGTSAPELVTTVVSTIRHNRDVAIGNLIGSSVYNIALILGVTALVDVDGLRVSAELVRIDLPVMTAAVLACIPIFVRGRRVTRLNGGLFVLAYAIYLGYLILVRA